MGRGYLKKLSHPTEVLCENWISYRHVGVRMINKDHLGLFAINADTNNLLNVVLCNEKNSYSVFDPVLYFDF